MRSRAGFHWKAAGKAAAERLFRTRSRPPAIWRLPPEPAEGAFAAVVVERGKPSKSRHFFTRRGSEFGHADEEGDCGALANARHADQEKQDGEEAFEFDGAALFETRGVRSNTTPNRAP
jgi:hypothetical protein